MGPGRGAHWGVLLGLTHFASFFAPLRFSGVERQFFELLSAHNSECSRAPGGAGVAGSLTPR